MKAKEPILSISCTAYNHAKFIRQCLDGFIMQKTTFPFIAIVHDDASTDGTDSIIREYAERYPDIIKPIFETENQYSKRDGSLRKIMENAIPESVKYVAYCEGDDYWISDNKLQIQFEFLEKHLDYGMYCHNANVVDFDSSFLRVFSKTKSGTLLPRNIIREWIIPTASILLRREILKERVYIKNARHGDFLLHMAALNYGKIYYDERILSAYRINNPNSASAQFNMDRVGYYTYFANELDQLNDIYKQKYSKDINFMIKKYRFKAKIISLSEHSSLVSKIIVAYKKVKGKLKK